MTHDERAIRRAAVLVSKGWCDSVEAQRIARSMQVRDMEGGPMDWRHSEECRHVKGSRVKCARGMWPVPILQRCEKFELKGTK